VVEGVADASREADVFHELGRLGILDPEAKSLPKAPPSLVERAPMRMATTDPRDARDPRTTLVSLEDHSVPASPVTCHAAKCKQN
jgi:hypothetical protein